MKTFKTMVANVGDFQNDGYQVKDLCDQKGINTTIVGASVYFHVGQLDDTSMLVTSPKKHVISAINTYTPQDIETPEEREVFESMSSAKPKLKVGDEVATREGLGTISAFVTQKGVESCIVQFEDEWGVFDLDELRTEIDTDYLAGRTLRELFIKGHRDSETQLGFEALTNPAREAWIELAKHVKPIDEETK